MSEMRKRVSRKISEMVAEDRPSDEIADAIFDELREPTNEMLEASKRYMDSWMSNLTWWNSMLATAKFVPKKDEG